jgi:hypothetical protein
VSSGRKCHQTMSLWFCGVWIDQAILKLKHQTFWKSDQVWWSYGILNTTRFRKFCTTLQYKHIVLIWPQLDTFLACFKPIFWDELCFCVSLWGLWYIYIGFVIVKYVHLKNQEKNPAALERIQDGHHSKWPPSVQINELIMLWHHLLSEFALFTYFSHYFIKFKYKSFHKKDVHFKWQPSWMVAILFFFVITFWTSECMHSSGM